MDTKTKIIKILQSENIISGQDIADKLNVSRNMVWKSIKGLEQDGYVIQSFKNGYKFISFPEKITKEEIVLNCKTDLDIIIFDEINSTNVYAKENLHSFNKNTLIISQKQLMGKGRFGRKFFSEEGGVYMSFVFKDSLEINYAPHVTLFTAVAVCKALENLFKIKLDIKWVNDIFLNGKKLCGILSEASISCEEKKISNFIIGIGINATNNLPPELLSIATTLQKNNLKPINKSIIIAEIIKNLQNLPRDILTKNYFKEYKKRLFIIGKQVIIDGKTGIVIKLNKDCSLTVDINGKQEKFYAGDVSLKI